MQHCGGHAIALWSLVAALVNLCPAAADSLAPRKITQTPIAKNAPAPGFLGGPQLRNPNFWCFEPLFVVAQTLLDYVQPRTVSQFMDEFDVHSTEDLTVAMVTDHWQDRSKYAIGWAVCIGFGVLLFITVPIVGMCYCCCRLAGNCGGEERLDAERPDERCKFVSCTLGLCFIFLILIACVSVGALTTTMVYKEIDHGFVDNTLDAIYKTETFRKKSMDEINYMIFNGISDTILDIFKVIDDVPAETVHRLGNVTRANPLLEKLEYFSDNIRTLQANLTDMQVLKERLSADRADLAFRLSSSRKRIYSLLQQCASAIPACQEAQSNLERLVPYASYSNLSSTTKAAMTLAYAIRGNLDGEIISGIQEFRNISEDVRMEVRDVNAELKHEIHQIKSEVWRQYNKISEGMRNISLTPYVPLVEDMKPYMEFSAYIFWCSMTSLLCFIMFILLLWCCGLSGSACCSRPRPNNTTCKCTTKNAAQSLMAGNAFVFIFHCVFTLVTMCIFLVGGLLHTNVCRHLMAYDETMQTIENDFLQNYFQEHFNYSLNIKDALAECKKDGALYTALHIDENGFNITRTLDLRKYGVPLAIEQLKNSSVKIGPLMVLTPLANRTILYMGDVLNDIDFEGYRHQLTQPITCGCVLNYARTLNNISRLISSRSPQLRSLAENLNKEAEILKTIYNESIVEMVGLRHRLYLASLKAREIIQTSALDIVPIQLTYSQDRINSQGNEIMKDILAQTSDDVLKIMQDLIMGVDVRLRYYVAQCRPLYDAMDSIARGSCVYFLHPLHGLWICLGLFLIFSLLGVIFATVLVGHYRRPPYNLIIPAVNEPPDRPWSVTQLTQQLEQNNYEDYRANECIAQYPPPSYIRRYSPEYVYPTAPEKPSNLDETSPRSNRSRVHDVPPAERSRIHAFDAPMHERSGGHHYDNMPREIRPKQDKYNLSSDGRSNRLKYQGEGPSYSFSVHLTANTQQNPHRRPLSA